MQEFEVNESLKVRLENGETNIYVNDQLFRQCKFLLLDIPVEEMSSFEDIESIDEAEERLDKSLEEESVLKYQIPPEVEFWGHCSNLQVWAENGYNTHILHRNLAFPLLKALVNAGDEVARRVFKEEIVKRMQSGVPSVVIYLLQNFYSRLGNEGELKKDGLIETGEKVQKEKVKICHHKLTPVAKKSLEILALWLHNFNNSGEPTNIIDPKYFRFFLADLDTLRAEKTERELDLQEDSY